MMIQKQHKYILNFYRSARSNSTNVEVTEWAKQWLIDSGISVTQFDCNGQTMLCCITTLEQDEMNILDLAHKSSLDSILYIDNNNRVMRFYLDGNKDVLGVLYPTEYPTKSSYYIDGEYWDVV